MVGVANIIKVLPSGALLATCAAAMAPEAPARFSTTTVCLRRSANRCPTMREAVSVGPPAGNGTISLMVLSGALLCCACTPMACPPNRAPIKTQRNMQRIECLENIGISKKWVHQVFGSVNTPAACKASS